jgi:tetratricopeptide (TPR) repeat protein/TolB-like protein
MSAAPRPENWSELASLVDALLDAPPERRASIIEDLSAGDPVRRLDLERLLQECEREPTLLGRPAAERFPVLLDEEATGFPESLAARYRLMRELGRGGMATVYLVHDLKHDRPVALKVLHPELAVALGPERFLREIRIAARLRHPHIVPLYDSGEADGLLYYVMPYIDGESLRDRLRREPQLPVDDALGIAREVADGLTHAHEHELIHRDIKPENILLEGGHALVADFGIARGVGGAATTQLTVTGLALGTPAYMSPEQALGDVVDVRTDVYALGCVLYEMLAGQAPFAAPTAQASIARRLTEPAPRIRQLRDEVPAQLEEAIMTALERDPTARFPSAAAFRDALAGGPGALARSDRAEAQAGRPITLRPKGRVLAAGTALVLLVGVAIALPRIARLPGGGPPVAAGVVPGVAVLPFRTTGADPELWHEGIVDMLSYNLEGLGQLRKIDPVTVLTGWRRMGGSASSALTADKAREVGRRLGSRYVVTGSAVQIGGDVQLIAEVQDVKSGKFRGAVRVTRPTDSASSLVDELTLELLRGNLLPTDGEYPAPSLSQATTSSLPALKAYLAGEREYRTAQWTDAVRHYQRAIEADSNFAPAWFRLSSACGWGGCPMELAEGYDRRAMELANQLPDRDARRIRAMKRLDAEALERLTAAYPDDVEAWVALGESYFHIGGTELRSVESFRTAFTRAVRLHPYYGEPYIHLIEDAFLRLDSLDAQRLIDGNVALGADQASCAQVSYDLVWGTPAARTRAMSVLDTVAPIWCVEQVPLAAPAQVLDRLAHSYGAMADTASQAHDRTFALWRLLQLRVSSGLITAARRALARLAGAPVAGISAARWEIMLHLSGFPDSAAAHRAARTIATGAGPTDNFWIGALAIEEGRWNDVQVVRRALEHQAASSDTASSSSTHHIRAYAGAYATALGAYANLVRGDRSQLGAFESALARLPALLPLAPTMLDHEQPQQYLRYRVGKLLFDDGRMQDAQRYFQSFNQYDYFYTSPAELYLGRIAEAGGRRKEALTHYGRFVRWWRYADEPLRPQWDEARQALSRLTGE